DGVGKTGGNISNGTTFFLGLLYFGVHKYRTPCSEVNRMFGVKCLVRKILYRVIQRLGEGFNERTASGGAGFIELYGIYRMIFDFDTFHILTADVENTVHVRLKERGCIIMRNCLDLSLVQKERRLHQCFSVSGGAGI